MAMKNSVRFRSVGFSHRHETTSGAVPRIGSSEAHHRRLLMFALTEAGALIIRYRDAVLAIARALMIHKTLDAVMIHEIIGRAPRADRARTCANA
jgi:hypothetical protein